MISQKDASEVPQEGVASIRRYRHRKSHVARRKRASATHLDTCTTAVERWRRTSIRSQADARNSVGDPAGCGVIKPVRAENPPPFQPITASMRLPDTKSKTCAVRSNVLSADHLFPITRKLKFPIHRPLSPTLLRYEALTLYDRHCTRRSQLWYGLRLQRSDFGGAIPIGSRGRGRSVNVERRIWRIAT